MKRYLRGSRADDGPRVRMTAWSTRQPDLPHDGRRNPRIARKACRWSTSPPGWAARRLPPPEKPGHGARGPPMGGGTAIMGASACVPGAVHRSCNRQLCNGRVHKHREPRDRDHRPGRARTGVGTRILIPAVIQWLRISNMDGVTAIMNPDARARRATRRSWSLDAGSAARHPVHGQ